jgi:hypothetical protein
MSLLRQRSFHFSLSICFFATSYHLETLFFLFSFFLFIHLQAFQRQARLPCLYGLGAIFVLH